MVKGQVKKIMNGALLRFAKENSVETTKISIVIHSKSEECEPLYFKTIEGKSEKDEAGNTKNLDFNRDILNVKFDLSMRAYLTANFLKGWFKKTSLAESIETNNIYLFIGCNDLEAKDLKLILFNGAKAVKKLSLDDVFGED